MQVRGIEPGLNDRTKVTGVQGPGQKSLVVHRRNGPATFAEALQKAGRSQKIIFSKHAEDRLRSWGEDLGPERMSKLESAVELAQAKGARSTLVVLKGVALVVAPETRTVITVIPGDRMRESVFTSIDSAVLAER